MLAYGLHIFVLMLHSFLKGDNEHYYVENNKKSEDHKKFPDELDLMVPREKKGLIRFSPRVEMI